MAPPCFWDNQSVRYSGVWVRGKKKVSSWWKLEIIIWSLEIKSWSPEIISWLLEIISWLLEMIIWSLEIKSWSLEKIAADGIGQFSGRKRTSEVYPFGHLKIVLIGCCLCLFVGIHWINNIDICWYSLVFSVIHQYALVFVDICWYLLDSLVFDGIHWYLDGMGWDLMGFDGIWWDGSPELVRYNWECWFFASVKAFMCLKKKMLRKKRLDWK